MTKTMKSEKEPPHFKRTGMPLNGEWWLNEALKMAFGFLFFWMLYYFMFDIQMDFWTQVSYIMLYSLLASGMALGVAWLAMVGILLALRRPKKSFLALNPFRDTTPFLRECLIVLLSAMFMASGLLILLGQVTSTWEQFLLLYIAVKFISWGVAYVLAAIIGKSWIASLAFLLTFLYVLFIAVTQITQTEVLAL
jgi:hypothetical protein